MTVILEKKGRRLPKRKSICMKVGGINSDPKKKKRDVQKGGILPAEGSFCSCAEEKESSPDRVRKSKVRND